MRHYTLYIYRIVLTCLLLAAGTGSVVGQEGSFYKGMSTDTIYVIPGEAYTLQLQDANVRDNLNGFIRCHLEDKNGNIIENSNYLSSSDLTKERGSSYYTWNRSSNAIAPAAQVTYTNSNINNDNYHVIVYEASSSYQTRNGNYSTPTVERRYIVQNAQKKSTELAGIRNNFVANTEANAWLSNPEYPLSPENINSIKNLFKEVYDIHTPLLSGTSYRLADLLKSYCVPGQYNGVEYINQVRWRIYRSDGTLQKQGHYNKTRQYSEQNTNKIVTEKQQVEKGYVVLKNSEFVGEYALNSINIFSYYYPINGLSEGEQHHFYLTAEVRYGDNGEWYPISFITVYLEPYAEVKTQTDLNALGETDPYYQRTEKYLSEPHYRLLKEVSFDPAELGAPNASTNYPANVQDASNILDVNSYYAYARAADYENRRQGNRFVGRGEYGLYKSLGMENVSPQNITGVNNYYSNWAMDSYKVQVYDRTHEKDASKYGYFLYVDASDEPGVITKVNLEKEALCPNTRVVVSAWVCNLQTTDENVPGALNADIGLTFKGVLGKEETILNKFYTGEIKNNPQTDSNFNTAAKWQQVFFYFNFSSQIEFDSYVLELSNNCRHSQGADYAIDDIQIYRSLPNISVERENACEASTLNVETDILTLFANMGWVQDKPIPYPQSVLSRFNTRIYRYGIDALNPDNSLVDGDTYAGNFYYAFIDNLDPDNPYQQDETFIDNPTGGGYRWVNINKNYPEMLQSASYSTRVVISTKVDDRIATDQATAAKYEALMNIQAITDFNKDYALIKNALQNPIFDEEANLIVQDAEVGTFTIASDKARELQEIEVTGLPTLDEVRNAQGLENLDLQKQIAYAKAVTNLYGQLKIPPIKCPWLSPGDKRILTMNAIDVNNTDLKYVGEPIGENQTASGKYHVVLMTSRQVEGEDIRSSLFGNCALVSEFTVRGAATIKVEAVTNAETALCVGAQRKITAKLDAWNEDTGEQVDLDKGTYIFDWYMGPIDEYNKITINNNISLKEAIQTYRESFSTDPETEQGSITVEALEKWGSSERQIAIRNKLIELINEDKLRTGTKAEEPFVMIVNSPEIVAMPYMIDDPASGILYCTNVTKVNFDITTNEAPALYPGYEGASEKETSAALRLGIENLTQGTTLNNIPIRSNIKKAGGATALRSENAPLYLYDENSGNAIEVGTVSLNAVDVIEGNLAGYLNITWNQNTATSMEEGKQYNLQVPFSQYDTNGLLGSECDGLALLPVKVVPEYLTWAGNQDDTWCNDEGYWTISTKDELYGKVSNTTESVTSFSPLYFSKITIPQNGILSLTEEVDKENTALNLSSVTDATSGIGDDMAVNNTGTNNAIEVVPYYGNKVSQIYFKPKAKLVNQHYLDYEKAWVEFEMSNNDKRWFASPLQDVYAGDFYAPTITGRQETGAFNDITYNGTNSRWAPAFYQKAWNSTIKYKPDTDEDMKEVAAVKSNWSIEYNDVTVSYPIGKGFYLSVEEVPTSNGGNGTALVRLPKADAVTDYQYEAAMKASVLRADDTYSKANSGQLAAYKNTDGSLSNGTVTVKLDDLFGESEDDVAGEGSTLTKRHFLVGNPYMTYLNMDEFFNRNSNLAKKYWRLENGTARAVVGTPDVPFGEDGAATGTVEPMEAFFVELEDNATVNDNTITFTPSMMSATEIVEDGATTKGATATNPVITITAERGEIKSVATLSTSDRADNGYKADEDAVVLLDSELDAPMVYTVAGSLAAQVNAVKSIDNIGLGLYNDSREEVTITINGLSRSANPLYLYDAHTGKSVKMEGDSHSMTIGGDSHGRYYLRNSEPGSELDNAISIQSTQRGRVIVSAIRSVKEIKAFSLSGSQVCGFSVNSTQYGFDLPAGIYMIYASDGERERTEKVIVR